MPGGDRTGPEGRGPMTGRGAGDCSGNQEPGVENDSPRRGFGFGFGFGGGRGLGAQGVPLDRQLHLTSLDLDKLGRLSTISPILQKDGIPSGGFLSR